MTAARPRAKPKMTRAELLAIVAQRHGAQMLRAPLLIVGVRGYYRDSMGAVGRNDRAIYDDALFVVADDAFVAFNGNTDPSGYRKGRGFGAGKGMASLNPGVWPVYRLGVHRAGTKGGHEALRQDGGPVTVTRDGDPPYEAAGMFGINIHRGGWNSTSSEGCQTVPPDQWPSFIALVTDLTKRLAGAAWRRETITYVLLEGV